MKALLPVVYIWQVRPNMRRYLFYLRDMTDKQRFSDILLRARFEGTAISSNFSNILIHHLSDRDRGRR